MRLLLAAVLLTTVAMPAFAADPGMPMEEPPVGFNWSGGYVGGTVGWAWVNSDLEEFESPSDEIIDEGYTLGRDYDGFAAGAHVGYNHQFSNNVVLGVEADFVWADIDESSVSNLDNDGVEGDDFQRTTVDWYSSIRARLGYAADRFMPYVTGGIGFGRVAVEFGDLDSGVPDLDDFISGSSTQVGWALGGGVEYAFTDQLIGRAEYLYLDLGDKTYVNTDGDNIRFDTKISTVRFGLSYKF